LVHADVQREKTKNQGFKYGRFDFIITNPPFGSTVKQTEKAYMHQYRFAVRDVDWLNPKSIVSERPNQDTEILFIEQSWNYLNEGGYLAIVIPDSILTNSSLQYIRDNIEELYRIVAVVSMPGTAFAATGAGVKSSVLFLKKHTAAQTKKIRDTKQALKDDIRKEHNFLQELHKLEKEKRSVLKNLTGLDNTLRLMGKALKGSDAYKSWSKGVSASIAEKLENVRYRLSKIYEDKRREALDDYDIFMAIAEDIGYDATGRTTKVNELDSITTELTRFITKIEEGRE
jgi:type I restriction-modification system DNA methylase subunit